MTPLAILGGDPAFPEGLPFVRPAVPSLARVTARLAPSYEQGQLTNGPLVRGLEEQVADRLQVEHAIAVASCTAGLMLTVQVLAPGRPTVLPAFTFSATAHAAAWNGCTLRFADCDRHSFQLDPNDTRTRAVGSALVIGTHCFGAPCSVEEIERVGREQGVPVVFDAAHAFGATCQGRPVGSFGDAEVFSLSPTKPLVAGEGGLVTTNHADVADTVRIGRDYGNAGDYDCRFFGLNARMSELHAAVALESLLDLDQNLARRTDLARRYRDNLGSLPGVCVQRVAEDDTSTWKDVSITVDEAAFGLSRDDLVAVLRADGIDTRCYFDPPVHRQKVYLEPSTHELPHTEWVSARVVSLPIYPDLTGADVDRIIDIVARAHVQAEQVAGLAALAER